jgi:hypothetical protein
MPEQVKRPNLWMMMMKLKVNSASCLFLLYGYITMQINKTLNLHKILAAWNVLLCNKLVTPQKVNKLTACTKQEEPATGYYPERHEFSEFLILYFCDCH